MSLTFVKQKTPAIAYIKSKNPKLHNARIYIRENDEMDDDDDTVQQLTIGEGVIVPLPRLIERQRESLFISAPSGAGKSVFLANYVGEMLKHKSHAKKDIFLFSASKEEDPAFSKIKNNIKVIDIFSDDLYSLKVEELKESICIFDDWDSTDKRIVDFLCNLLKAILERGRKLKIDCFVIVHDGKQYKKTKPLIFEASSFVLFPRSGIAACNSFLRTYMSFGKRDCDMVKQLKTRSVFVHKASPQYLVSAKRVMLL